MKNKLNKDLETFVDLERESSRASFKNIRDVPDYF